MLLTIDIGNTNIKAGIYQKNKPVSFFLFPGNIKKYSGKIKRVVIVSVSEIKLRQVMKVLYAFKIKKNYIFIVGKDIKVPIKSEYNKEQIGQDRLVTAYSAMRIYGSPVLIVDFGTAVTFDLVSRRNIYKGGLIVPGINMSLKSLHKDTSLLPEIELGKVKGFIGKDTKTSINNGVIYAYASLCDGIVKRFRKRFRGLKIVATGGNAGLISKYSASINTVNDNLALEGILYMSEIF